MSFFKVTGWCGDDYSLTAKALYERVLEDSQSDYYWIAPATELVRVCNEPCFPEMQARGIKMIILNCFANLELKKEYPSGQQTTDDSAVQFCYNSLPSTDEMAKKVKDKYLTAIIHGITKYSGAGYVHFAQMPPNLTTMYTEHELRLPIHIGKTYRNKVEEWEKSKFDEYVSVAYIDFYKLRGYLYADFDRMVKSAEEEGAFAKEDKVYRKEMRKFRKSLEATGIKKVKNLYI